MVVSCAQSITLDCELYPGFPLFAALLIAFIVVFVILVPKGKSDDIKKPKDIDPDKEASKELKDILRTQGQRISHDIYLRQGPITKGRIVYWSFFRYDRLTSMIENAKSNKSVQKLMSQVRNERLPHDNFFLLEIMPAHGFAFGFIIEVIEELLNSIFGWFAKWYLVDMRAVSVGPLEYNISIFWQQRRDYKKVYVFSEMGRQVIKEMIIDKLTVKQSDKGILNRIPTIQYHDLRSAKFAAKAREMQDLKDKSWKKREENLEKEPDEE